MSYAVEQARATLENPRCMKEGSASFAHDEGAPQIRYCIVPAWQHAAATGPAWVQGCHEVSI